MSFGANPKNAEHKSTTAIINLTNNAGYDSNKHIGAIINITITINTIFLLKKLFIFFSASSGVVVIMFILFLFILLYLLDNKYIIYLIVFYIKV